MVAWPVPTSLVAKMVLVKMPASVGVPLIKPVEPLMLRPVGRLEAAQEVGVLVAAHWKVMEVPVGAEIACDGMKGSPVPLPVVLAWMMPLTMVNRFPSTSVKVSVMPPALTVMKDGSSRSSSALDLCGRSSGTVTADRMMSPMLFAPAAGLQQ